MGLMRNVTGERLPKSILVLSCCVGCVAMALAMTLSVRFLAMTAVGKS